MASRALDFIRARKSVTWLAAGLAFGDWQMPDCFLEPVEQRLWTVQVIEESYRAAFFALAITGHQPVQHW